MLSKSAVLTWAFKRFRENPEWRAGQSVMNAATELYPGRVPTVIPTQYNCWNNDNRITDYLWFVSESEIAAEYWRDL